jgi:hypothetical protein
MPINIEKVGIAGKFPRRHVPQLKTPAAQNFEAWMKAHPVSPPASPWAPRNGVETIILGEGNRSPNFEETRHEKALINEQIRAGKGGRKSRRRNQKQRKTRRAHVKL